MPQMWRVYEDYYIYLKYIKKNVLHLAGYLFEKARNILSDGKEYVKDAALGFIVNRIY
jgi:hypothetical protein